MSFVYSSLTYRLLWSTDDLLNTDKFIFNQNVKGDNSGYTINQLSEKLIDQYELRIAEKNVIINELKEQVNELRKRLKKEGNYAGIFNLFLHK